VAAGIVGLLLAGGRARRFGADKLLHPLPGGQPIVLASLNRLEQAGVDRCLVLVAPRRPLLMRALEESGARLQICDEAPQGMGQTLACGVRATCDAAGWVVALADMPFVQVSTIARVVERLRAGAAIVAPRYRGRRGHPVGFSAAFGDALAALYGDVGARQVLESNAERLEYVDVDDAGILRDVDTREDLEAALRD